MSTRFDASGRDGSVLHGRGAPKPRKRESPSDPSLYSRDAHGSKKSNGAHDRSDGPDLKRPRLGSRIPPGCVPVALGGLSFTRSGQEILEDLNRVLAEYHVRAVEVMCVPPSLGQRPCDVNNGNCLAFVKADNARAMKVFLAMERIHVYGVALTMVELSNGPIRTIQLRNVRVNTSRLDVLSMLPRECRVGDIWPADSRCPPRIGGEIWYADMRDEESLSSALSHRFPADVKVAVAVPRKSTYTSSSHRSERQKASSDGRSIDGHSYTGKHRDDNFSRVLPSSQEPSIGSQDGLHHGAPRPDATTPNAVNRKRPDHRRDLFPSGRDGGSSHDGETSSGRFRNAVAPPNGSAGVIPTPQGAIRPDTLLQHNCKGLEMLESALKHVDNWFKKYFKLKMSCLLTKIPYLPESSLERRRETIRSAIEKKFGNVLMSDVYFLGRTGTIGVAVFNDARVAGDIARASKDAGVEVGPRRLCVERFVDKFAVTLRCPSPEILDLILHKFRSPRVEVVESSQAVRRLRVSCDELTLLKLLSCNDVLIRGVKVIVSLDRASGPEFISRRYSLEPNMGHRDTLATEWSIVLSNAPFAYEERDVEEFFCKHGRMSGILHVLRLDRGSFMLTGTIYDDFETVMSAQGLMFGPMGKHRKIVLVAEREPAIPTAGERGGEWSHRQPSPRTGSAAAGGTRRLAYSRTPPPAVDRTPRRHASSPRPRGGFRDAGCEKNRDPQGDRGYGPNHERYWEPERARQRESVYDGGGDWDRERRGRGFGASGVAANDRRHEYDRERDMARSGDAVHARSLDYGRAQYDRRRSRDQYGSQKRHSSSGSAFPGPPAPKLVPAPSGAARGFEASPMTPSPGEVASIVSLLKRATKNPIDSSLPQVCARVDALHDAILRGVPNVNNGQSYEEFCELVPRRRSAPKATRSPVTKDDAPKAPHVWQGFVRMGTPDRRSTDHRAHCNGYLVVKREQDDEAIRKALNLLPEELSIQLRGTWDPESPVYGHMLHEDVVVFMVRTSRDTDAVNKQEAEVSGRCAKKEPNMADEIAPMDSQKALLGIIKNLRDKQRIGIMNYGKGTGMEKKVRVLCIPPSAHAFEHLAIPWRFRDMAGHDTLLVVVGDAKPSLVAA